MARSHGLAGSGGARDSQLFSGYIITGMFSEIHWDVTTATTYRGASCNKDKKTSAVRSRISPKLIFANSVGYFDRAYYGVYVTFPRALGFVARREPARPPCASLGPGRGPWHVFWGSKSHVPSGRHSEDVEPSRPLETHGQVKRMSDCSCTSSKNVRRLTYGIWDLECRQCRQTLLGDGKVKTTQSCNRTAAHDITSNQQKIISHTYP